MMGSIQTVQVIIRCSQLNLDWIWAELGRRKYLLFKDIERQLGPGFLGCVPVFKGHFVLKYKMDPQNMFWVGAFAK